MATTNTKTTKTTVDKTTKTTTAKTTKTTANNDRPFIPVDVRLTDYVVVRNGFQGNLVYQSKKTGEVYFWDEFGSEQEMELRELVNAKNSYKGFFINNWFMFDEDWIVDYLGVRQFYKNALSLDEFDSIFELTPTEIKQKVSLLSEGQKKSLSYRAKELISEKKIDSLSVISAIEEALGLDIVEK